MTSSPDEAPQHFRHPPPQDAFLPRRGDIGGSISNQMPGWDRKRVRTQREPVLEPVNSQTAQEGNINEPQSLLTSAQAGDAPSVTAFRDYRVTSTDRHLKSSFRKVKGKETVKGNIEGFSPSASRASSSKPASFNSPRKVAKGIAGTRQLQQDTVIPSMSDASPTDKDLHKNYRPTSREFRREEARRLFMKEWNKYGFHSKMNPKHVAEYLAQLKVDGVNEEKVRRYATDEILRVAGQGYYDSFANYLKNLNASIRRNILKLERTGALDGLDEDTKREIVFEKAKNRQVNAPSMSSSRMRPDRFVKLEILKSNIEKAARKHLMSKKIDFDKASLAVVEEGMRDFDYKQIKSIKTKDVFVVGWYAILRSAKGAKDADINRYIAQRKRMHNIIDSKNRKVNKKDESSSSQDDQATEFHHQ